MQKIIVMSLIVIILAGLTGCVVSGTPGMVDPYEMKAYGESLQQAADAQIAATQQAVQIERQQSEMRMRETQQAYLLVATQTAAAQAVQFTQAALASQAAHDAAQATQQAQILQNTQAADELNAAVTQQSRQATAVAIELAVDYERELHEKQMLWLGVREAVKTLFLAALLAMIGYGLFHFTPIIIDWIIEWQDRKHSLQESRMGTVAFILDANGIPQPMLLANADHYRSRPRLDAGSGANAGASSIPPVETSVREVTATSPINRQARHVPVVQQEAIKLLQKSDPDDNKIIPCDKSGLRNEIWIQITDSMVDAGLIQKDASNGTHVINGTCRDVLYALEMLQVVLSPAPSRYVES